MNEIGVNDVMELQQWSGVNDDATRALRQRRYRARRLGSHPTASVLPVTCWCEDTVLFASRRTSTSTPNNKAKATRSLLEDPELRALARPACRSALRASAQPHAKLDRIIQPPPLFAQAQLLEEHPPLPRPRPTPKPETPNISR